MTTTLQRTIETVGESADGINFTSEEVETITNYNEDMEDSVVHIGNDLSFTLTTLKKLVSDAEYVLLQSREED